MKNHQYINGQLLQTNKTFGMLKQQQKEKIAEWLYEAYRRCMMNKEIRPTDAADTQIVTEVLVNIQKAGIWIPEKEIYNYYIRQKNRLRARLEEETNRNGVTE